jgi:hypothetical protein
MPPSCGTRCDLSTTPAGTGRRRTGAASLIEAHPNLAYLHYQVACCESLAGRTADAIEHLRQAIDKWEGCLDMAKEDSDFDPLRNELAFQDVIGR